MQRKTPNDYLGVIPCPAAMVTVVLLLNPCVPNSVYAGVFNIAHRGDSINAPENTIAAIDSAAVTADFTEFDVRLSFDGELILMHDSTVNRTTNGTGLVSSLTLPELKSLDAGSWFAPPFVGEQVPTIGEAMNAALAGNLQPLVERKAGSAADYHSEFGRQGFVPSDFRVIAFDWTFLANLDALNSDYLLGALGFGSLNQSIIDIVQANGADFLDWNHATVDQAAVDLAHLNGMELHVYTVNSESRMQQLIDLGVDGITTDDPALLRSLLVPEPSTCVFILGAFMFTCRFRKPLARCHRR